MERYDYLEAVKADVTEWLNDNEGMSFKWTDFDDADEAAEWLYDKLWVEDSVTGNASGSYYCNAWRAEEAICHNLDLLSDAVSEFGGGFDVLKEGAEACDVTIRCYLLRDAIAEVIDELDPDFDEPETGDDEDDFEKAVSENLACLG
jgi:hypothetical protein